MTDEHDGLAAAVELLLRTGRGQQGVEENKKGDPFFITPDGRLTELKGVYPPRRIEQRVTLQDAGSFCTYVNRFKDADSLVFAALTETGVALTAVLDYHGFQNELKTLEPGYCRHVARFQAIETPEWKTWLGANRKAMTQVEFATWLEDNLPLFVTPEGSDAPSGAELLELVKSLHGHQNARFNTALRLDNGAYSVNYDEEVSVKGSTVTRGGDIELPQVICAGIAVFQGAAKYAVSARLKTRIEDRQLKLWFETIGLHVIVRESILALVKEVAEETKIVPLLGAPN